jgi:hypothetical protein
MDLGRGKATRWIRRRCNEKTWNPDMKAVPVTIDGMLIEADRLST